MLIVSQCGAVDEGVHVPAADVTVTTVQGLLALRDAIDEALRYDMPKQAEPNGEVRGAPPIGEASSGEAATSTVVLEGGATGRKE